MKNRCLYIKILEHFYDYLHNAPGKAKDGRRKTEGAKAKGNGPPPTLDTKARNWVVSEVFNYLQPNLNPNSKPQNPNEIPTSKSHRAKGVFSGLAFGFVLRFGFWISKSYPL